MTRAPWFAGLACMLGLTLPRCNSSDPSTPDPEPAPAPAGDVEGTPPTDRDPVVRRPGAPSAPGQRPGPDEAEHDAPGRWHDAPTTGPVPLTEEQKAEIEQLEAIGYVAGSTPGGELRGVSRHDPDRAYDGLNFYTSGHHSGAILIDMKGQELHRWEYSFEQAWPGESPDQHTDFWRRAVLLESGEVLAIFEGYGLVKLDHESKPVWKSLIGAHHQLEVQPDGSIYVLTREPRLAPRINKRVPILEDFVSIVDPADGSELRRVSILKCLQRSPFHQRWKPSIARARDIFHTNTLKVLDGRHASRSPHFAAGNVLVSMRSTNALAILDMDRKKVVWMHTGDFQRQHDPTLLESGRMLLFDNRGREGSSSVQEFDPLTGQLNWQYRGTPEAPFYSRSCGSAQRLSNGNTLVTETDSGRAFELTADKEIVWEYHSPHRAGDDDEFVASLFEVVRLPLDFADDWLDRE